MNKKYESTSLSLLFFVAFVNGHGRLLVPPSRSSVWRDAETEKRYEGVTIPKNYNDNALFCGGTQTLIKAEGKCGVCGDSYYDPSPRANEAGGKYGLGLISRKYESGSWIDVTIQITAQHKGFFEFRLCDWNQPEKVVTKDCLDRHVLETDKGLQYSGITRTGTYIVKVKLPDGLTCSQCVLQWRYHTGNSWGCEAGVCGLGLGYQEEFYGCADVEISGNEEHSSTVSATTSTTTPMISSSKWTRTTTTPPRPVTGRVEPPSQPCEGVNYGRLYNWDCNSFYVCLRGFDKPFVTPCPAELVFDQEHETCNWKFLVPAPCGDSHHAAEWR